jgi:hypothetical protein
MRSLNEELQKVQSCHEAWASVSDVAGQLATDLHAVALQQNAAAAAAGIKAKEAADEAAQLFATQKDPLGAQKLHKEAKMWQLKADRLAGEAGEALQMADKQAKDRETGLCEVANMRGAAAALTFAALDELEKHSACSEVLKGDGKVGLSEERPCASMPGAVDGAVVDVDTLRTWLQEHCKQGQAGDGQSQGEGPSGTSTAQELKSSLGAPTTAIPATTDLSEGPGKQVTSQSV